MFRGSRSGRTYIAVLAALVPLGFAGWLVWQVLHGSGDGGDGAKTRAAPTRSGSGKDAQSTRDAGKNGGEDEPEANEDKTGDGRGGKRKGPLAGMTVVLDPGHNPHNHKHPDKISRRVDIGTGMKECDTTGTASNSGYPEAEFTLDLARRTRTALQDRGARVLLTHEGREARQPYGPCIDERARTGNRAHADAVVSLHADGAPSGSRGFHVILPAQVRQGKADTRRIVAPSRRLGTALRDAFHRATGEPPASYIGDHRGLDSRADLGGLNLSTVPKVFLECGNMRDPQDASRLTSAKWRTKAAHGVADGIADFLTASSPPRSSPQSPGAHRPSAR
ncbi:N-acetylmuramoyl-L-alanine amidase [Streptomyces boncukensis]|uniref:N-acetylmuramoyl-L-alanine amidase n=1 Tax=Streptomyces boncukensis TaxID=2711219 RepID=UPI0030B9C98A